MLSAGQQARKGSGKLNHSRWSSDLEEWVPVDVVHHVLDIILLVHLGA